MLTIVGGKSGRCCDGIGRRNFLKIGALGFGFGAMNLADLTRLEAATGNRPSTKSIINVHLGGGPPHQDMWDIKTDAPVEYRGEFNAVKTNVPGLEICEHFPLLAAMGDRFAVIRSMIGSVNEHSASTTQTGYPMSAMKAIGGPPTIGSVVSKLKGFNHGIPPAVTYIGGVGPGYLGAKYREFNAGDASNLLRLSRISAERMTKRADLLGQIDSLRRDLDAGGQMQAADTFTQQAVDVVLSGKMADALDIRKEDPAIVERYVGSRTGSLRSNERFLLARRLVEVGVRCVSIQLGGWDTHANNFKSLGERLLPALDRGLAALLSDLTERGLDRDVVVVVWGEFGRTPRVNSGAGRDHWPRVAGVFIAGGGMNMGQAVGATDRIGGEAAERPVHAHEVMATLYHHLGIDARTTQIIDPAGRPRYLLDHREPIAELVG